MGSYDVVIAGLIQFALHLITEPLPCFIVDVIQEFVALSSTLCLRFDPKISNFYLSVQRTLFHYSIVQSLSTLAHWSILTLFCIINGGFLTTILP